MSWNEIELLSYDQAEKYEGAYMASMAQKYDEGRMEGKVEIARDLSEKNMTLKPFQTSPV